MSADNRFGLLKTAFDLAKAIKATIVTWEPDYLAEVAELSGRDRGDLPTFRSWVLAPDEDRFAEDQLPSCIVAIPDVPTIYKARNSYNATWDVRVGCMVKGKDRDNSLELAMLYTAALRTLIVQKRSLGGFATDSVWTGERYDIIDFESRRSVGAGAALFAITVDDVLDSHGGPLNPSVDPTVDPGAWPTVDPLKIHVTYDPEEP